MRNTYAVIDLGKLKNNIINILNKYDDYKYYIGVVKADSYGSGDRTIDTMIESGINYLAVSSLEEAIAVRKNNKEIPILCFGYVDINDIELVAVNNITLSIISYEYYKELKKADRNIKVHLKLNTGMNRFGINDKYYVQKIVDDIKSTNMYLEGIYTHLATSGLSDKYYDLQIKKFNELVSLINLNEIEIVHVFNSLALARHDKLDFCNGVRLGLMMYGFSYNVGKLSFKNRIKRLIKLRGKRVTKVKLTNNLELEKVLSLYSEVINILDLEKGDFVGYNASYIAKENEKIAVISIGHADIMFDIKYVCINNKRYKVVAVCMDYIMVKVDNMVKLKDKAYIINRNITVGELAKNTSPHHILVGISSRVKRKYKE